MRWKRVNAVLPALAAERSKRRNSAQCRSLQLSRNHEVSGIGLPFDNEDVRFATDLAIFYVLLPVSGAGIDGSYVPFATACALESALH